MRGHLLAIGFGTGAVAQPVHGGAHLDGELGEARHQVLLGSHRLRERGQALDQHGVAADRRQTTLLDALEGAR